MVSFRAIGADPGGCMILSVILVFGGLGLYFLLLWLGIYRLHPIETYAAMASGTALAFFNAFRHRGWWRYATAAALLLLTASIGYWTLVLSRTPRNSLAVRVGDAMPSFSLPDQDGVEFSSASREGVTAALYLFYRGDW